MTNEFVRKINFMNSKKKKKLKTIKQKEIIITNMLLFFVTQTRHFSMKNYHHLLYGISYKVPPT